MERPSEAITEAGERLGAPAADAVERPFFVDITAARRSTTKAG
jgi:hypothetical protein